VERRRSTIQFRIYTRLCILCCAKPSYSSVDTASLGRRLPNKQKRQQPHTDEEQQARCRSTSKQTYIIIVRIKHKLTVQSKQKILVIPHNGGGGSSSIVDGRSNSSDVVNADAVFLRFAPTVQGDERSRRRAGRGQQGVVGMVRSDEDDDVCASLPLPSLRIVYYLS